MPYLCLSRADIPNGVLQVLDLWPNVSQRNAIYDPPGQTKYVNRCQNDTLVALSANTTTKVYNGLAAYLIDNVIDSGGATITVTAANQSAVAIIARLDAGSALALANINTAIQGTSAGNATELDGGGSTGSVADVLKILAGGEFVLPSGSLVGGLAAGAQLGAFTSGTYRPTYDTGALKISFGEGQLATFCASTFTYEGVADAAVVVYSNDGTVYTG